MKAMSMESHQAGQVSAIYNPSEQSETSLLFLDSLTHQSPGFNSDEIVFKQPILLQLIRILKSESNPHQNFKFLVSQTQTSIIKNFEIFAKNLDSPSDRFEVILDPLNINENAEMDSLIPFTKTLRTDHILVRGEYEKISVAIYGQLLPMEEADMITKKQYDISQANYQPVKSSLSKMLSPEEEKELEDALTEVRDGEDGKTNEKEDEHEEKKEGVAEEGIIEEVDEEMKKLEVAIREVLEKYKELSAESMLADESMKATSSSGGSPQIASLMNNLKEVMEAYEKLMNRRCREESLQNNLFRQDQKVTIPENFIELIANSLKGGKSESVEIMLGLDLCRVLGTHQCRVKNMEALMGLLLNKSFIQRLAEILLTCKTTAMKLKLLDSIYWLVTDTQFLQNLMKSPIIVRWDTQPAGNTSRETGDINRNNATGNEEKTRKKSGNANKSNAGKAEGDDDGKDDEEGHKDKKGHHHHHHHSSHHKNQAGESHNKEKTAENSTKRTTDRKSSKERKTHHKKEHERRKDKEESSEEEKDVEANISKKHKKSSKKTSKERESQGKRRKRSRSASKKEGGSDTIVQQQPKALKFEKRQLSIFTNLNMLLPLLNDNTERRTFGSNSLLTLGEALEKQQYKCDTFYQLLLALIVVKQNALVVKAVKRVIEKIEYAKNVLKLKTKLSMIMNKEMEAEVIYLLESIYEKLPKSEETFNFEIVTDMYWIDIWKNYDLIGALLGFCANQFEKEKPKSSGITLRSIINLLYYVIKSRGGIALLEPYNTKISDIKNKTQGVVLHQDTSRKLSFSPISNEIAISALASRWRLNTEEVIQIYKEKTLAESSDSKTLDDFASIQLWLSYAESCLRYFSQLISWINPSASREGCKKIEMSITSEQFINKLDRLSREIADSQQAADALARIVFLEINLEETFTKFRKISPEGLNMFLSIIFTLIKRKDIAKWCYIVPSQTLQKLITEELEYAESNSNTDPKHKQLLTEFTSYLQSYQLMTASPENISQTIRELWSQTTKEQSALNDIWGNSFVKFAFNFVSSNCGSGNGSQGSSGLTFTEFSSGENNYEKEKGIIRMIGIYDCLGKLLHRRPSLISKYIDSGLLAHLRYLLHSLSQTYQSWVLPAFPETWNNTTGATSGTISEIDKQMARSQYFLCENYYELTNNALIILKEMHCKIMISNDSYSDSALIEALLKILSHVVNKQLGIKLKMAQLNNCNTYIENLLTSILQNIMGIFIKWISSQPNFFEKILIESIWNLIADFPSNRIGGYYLLMAVISIFKFWNDQEKVNYLSNLLIDEITVNEEKKEAPGVSSGNGTGKSNATTIEKKKPASVSSEDGESSNNAATMIVNKCSILLKNLVKPHGNLLGYLMESIYLSNDLKFFTQGIATITAFCCNELNGNFAIALTEYLASQLKRLTSSLPIRGTDLEMQPSSSSPLSAGAQARLAIVSHPLVQWCNKIGKWLYILEELLSTPCKYALVKSQISENLIDLLKILHSESIHQRTQKIDSLEMQLIKCLSALCSIPTFALVQANTSENNSLLCELLPSIDHLQRIVYVISQHLRLDPPSFRLWSSAEPKYSDLIISHYLQFVELFSGNIVGCSILLFGNYYGTNPTAAKPLISFKELINQCNELVKKGAEKRTLKEVIDKIFTIALTIEANRRNCGSKIVTQQGIAAVLFEDLRVAEEKYGNKSKDNYGEILKEIIPWYVQMEAETTDKKSKKSILITLSEVLSKDYLTIPSTAEKSDNESLGELPKPRSLDAIWTAKREYEQKQSVYMMLISKLTHKSLITAEKLSSIINHSLVLTNDSLLNTIIQCNLQEKPKESWVILKLHYLNSLLISYICDFAKIVTINFSAADDCLKNFSEAEHLQLEHANVLLSVQMMKRKQKEEIEKRRKLRVRPSNILTNKPLITPPPTSISPNIRKSNSSSQSRSISTHVDEYENYPKGTRNPFPQQFGKLTEKKPGTPIGAGGIPTVAPPIQASPSREVGENYLPVSAVETPTKEPSRIVSSPASALRAAPPLQSEPIKQTYQNIHQLMTKWNLTSEMLAKLALIRKQGPPTSYPTDSPHQINPSIQAPLNPPPVGPNQFMNFLPLASKGGPLPQSPANLYKLGDQPHNLAVPPSPIMPSPHIVSSPRTVMPSPSTALTETEMKILCEIEAMKGDNPNDPRTQEKIKKILQQNPRIVAYLKAVYNK